MSFTDVMDNWLANAVLEEDREVTRRFFLSSLAYRLDGQDAEVARKEFRIVLPSGVTTWCEGVLVPIFDDEFFFCCRDIDSRKKYEMLEDERDTLQNEGRSLHVALSHDAVLSMVFDAQTGRRIVTDEDINESGDHGIEGVDDLVSLLRRRTRVGGVPEQIERGILEHGWGGVRPQDRILRLEWMMWDHAGDYRLFRVTFLSVQAVGSGSDRLFVVIHGIERNGTTDLWEAGLEGTGSTAGVLTRKGFGQYCLKECHEGGSEDVSHIFLLEIDDFWMHAIDEQEEMVRVLAEALGSLAVRDGVRTARILRQLFLVCAHVNERDDTAATKTFARMVKDHVDATLSTLGNITVSVGYAACGHDHRRGYRAAVDQANLALRTAQETGGNQAVAYRDEMSQEDWLKNLGPVRQLSRQPHVRIRTFGYFEVFVDGRPVLFTREKAKELLALLVDRQGGYVGSRDAVAVLWAEDQVNKLTRSRFRKVAMHLHDTLEEYGIEDIVVNEKGRRRLDVGRVTCDLYEYLSGDPRSTRLFQGVYMLNYSWAETTTAQLTFEREGQVQPSLTS